MGNVIFILVVRYPDETRCRRSGRSQRSSEAPVVHLVCSQSLTWMSPVSVSSCSEGGCHEEEAAAVHRPLQVLTQLSKPLLCVFCPSVRGTHQPGMRGAVGGEAVSGCQGGPGAGRVHSPCQGCHGSSPPPFNFVNNSMSVIDYPFSSEAAVAKWALWESVFNVLSAHCLRYEACWHRVVPGVCCCLCC